MSLYSCSATFSHFNFTYQSRYIRVYCIKTTSDSVIVCTVKWTIHFARQIVFVKTTDLYTRMHHVHFECHLTGLFFLKCGNQMIDLSFFLMKYSLTVQRLHSKKGKSAASLNQLIMLLFVMCYRLQLMQYISRLRRITWLVNI